jgi:glycosyltransferase involved in cell wall biosynthesis
VLVENERNLGLTKSLNRGIRASRGELIARQDADDASLPERLARQVAYLDVHPNIALVGTGSRWIDEHDAVTKEWRPTCRPEEIHQLLLSEVPFLHGTFMFRRDCLRDVGGGYDESRPVAQDCDLLLRLSERWDLANLPEILYVHRRHGDTVTARRRADQEHHLYQEQWAAAHRRLAYGRGRLGLTGNGIPEWVKSADRRWLARRYTWWSAAARRLSRKVALQFLVFALLIEPTTPEIWSYTRGILVRKVGLGSR